MAENKKYPENYAEEGGYVFCPVCGDKVSAGARFCTSCGSSLADASNMEDVYGGPEYFETKKKSMGRVYAGPEPVNKKDEAISGVYAGPEYFDKKDKPMTLLYAGPEYFGKRAKENVQKEIREAVRTVKDAADAVSEDEYGKMRAIYAAPAPKGLLSKIMGKIKK